MNERSGENSIDSPFPESPFSPFSPLDTNPPLLDPSMRSDSYLHSPRTMNRLRRPRPQWHPNFIPIQEEELHTPRTRRKRTVKGKWGSRFCRNQSCKRRFHPRPPPPPPPPTASIVVRGGTKKTMKKRHKKRRS